MIGYVQTLEKLGFELRTALAIDLILQTLPELYKQFVVNYEMHELDKPLSELLKMLQTAEESLTKGKGNSVLLVQGGKGKKKFKKAKKNGPKGKGNTEPKSNSSKLEPKGGVAKDSICHHCGEVGHWKRNSKQYLATKKKGEASTSGNHIGYVAGLTRYENNIWEQAEQLKSRTLESEQEHRAVEHCRRSAAASLPVRHKYKFQQNDQNAVQL
ncbi:unnamed protein product [Cuscuta campestris]|uniref:CCHC-type domain-containing protein n=1 Tax=Cuscuta campestris TaxID=132261 RepID=A0A484L4P0_9ASTE|nr:unnamed protein product [Cuscuta campestris]